MMDHMISWIHCTLSHNRLGYSVGVAAVMVISAGGGGANVRQ